MGSALGEHSSLLHFGYFFRLDKSFHASGYMRIFVLAKISKIDGMFK